MTLRAGAAEARAAVVAIAVLAVLALVGCSGPSDCGPSDGSRTITVRAVKPGVAAVQCWSGCEPGGRDLERAAEAEWTARLAVDQPASITLAARDDEGGLVYAERFRLRWTGCPATPTRTELELLRPEGGS